MIQIETLDHSPLMNEQVNQLVSKAFGYRGAHRFFDDFPVWNSHQVIRLGVLKDGILVSHVGIHFAEIHGKAGKHLVAMLGAVATEELYRGQGFSSALLKEALRLADEKKCEWTFLWGSEHEFYGKLGFSLAGSQARVLLATLPNVWSHREPKVKTGLTDKIFDFLMKRENGVILTADDREWFFSHKTVRWFYLEEPFAFVAFDRGMDLAHIVHEWGGDEEQLKILFSHVLSYDPQAQLLGAYEEVMQMGAEHLSIVEEFLCLARPAKLNAEWDEHFWISGLNAC